MTDPTTSLRRARARMVPPEPAFDRLLDRRRVKRRSSKIASIAMAFVVVAAGIVGGVVAFGGTGTAHHGVSSGGGQGSASGPNLVAGPGQYYYSKTDIYFGGGTSGAPTRTAGPWTLTEWFGTDASGRAVFSAYTGASTTGYSWPGAPDQTYAPGKFPLEDLSNLSTDPDRLLAQLSLRSMPGGASPNPIPTSSPGRSEDDTALLRTLQDLFDADGQFTPPSVRAAMFDVASRISGVETVRGATDPVGRPAIGLRWVVQYQDPPSHVEWFFDTSSKQLMAETWTQDGKVLSARVVTEGGIADSTQAVPKGGSRFFPPADRQPSFEG